MDGTISPADAYAPPLRLGWTLRSVERELLLSEGAFVLGRGPCAAVQLDDESVSRRHALLRLDSALPPSVEDLGSRNGTFVNDRQIAGRVQLAPGDCIGLGACRLELRRSGSGSAFRTAPITRRLSHPIGGGPLAPLSPRERELFALLARGVPQRQIAAELGLSIKTVETHRTRIGHKLGLRTRAELIRCALDAGVLS